MKTSDVYVENEPTKADGWVEDDTFETASDNSFDSNFEQAESPKILVDEVKTIAPEIIDVFKNSSERLNQKNEVISGVPNSILFYTALGLGVFIIYKILD